MMPWKSFIARTGTAAGLFGLALFAAIRLASAAPGGPTTAHFTYAGVLRNPDGTLPTAPRMTTLSFTFTDTQRSTSCGPVTTPVTIAAGGAFTTDVPLGPCASFFDGSDITYAITEAGATLTPDGGAPITPVPYARFADQAGNNSDCPAGYALVSATGGVTLCNRTITLGATTVRDEVVKVGTGASAFWIDRYEASVWGTDGVQRGASNANYPNLGDNGQWASGARGTLRAYSHAGVVPSRNVTWFQARLMCHAAGKRLVTRDEWFEASDGMVALDPTTGVNGNASGETRCNTMGSDARPTGGGSGCASSWGAQDMVGNLWEWTDEWYSGAGSALSVATMPAVTPQRVLAPPPSSPWPTGYGGDYTWNVNSRVQNGTGDVSGVPGAAFRGGSWGDGATAGVFSFDLDFGPSFRGSVLGFRCVVPR